MRRRGQATTEVLALVAAVGALTIAIGAAGGFAWLPGVVQRTFASSTPMASRDELTFLDRAIARAPGTDGPLVRDALLRLGSTVGPAGARSLAIDRILRAYAVPPGPRRRALADPSWALDQPAYDGDGPGTAQVWSDEESRTTTVVRLIAPIDERRWWEAQRPELAERVVGLGTSAAIALAGAIAPETSLAATVLGAGAAALAPGPGAVPAGSRDDDILICRFVWRRNRALPGWAAAHPIDATRLALGDRLPAVELTIVRAGHLLTRDVVRSHASSC